jgi:hypothetical protein
MASEKSSETKVDWKRRKVVVFESDDWGGCENAFVDTETRDRAMSVPAIMDGFTRYGGKMSPWSWHILETIEDMQRLFDLLLSFKGGDRRPVIFTPVYLIANPDFEAIAENNFTEYVDIGIGEGFPKHWRQGDIIGKAKEGIELGVWYPQTHGRAHHYSPGKLLRTLREEWDKAIVAAFEFRIIGFPLPSSDRHEVLGLEFDGLSPDQLDAWFGTGLDYFRRAFGYETPCAPITDAGLPEDVERLERVLSRHQIKFRSHSNMGFVGSAFFDKPFGPIVGKTASELDLTRLGWTAALDPLGRPDGEGAKGFTDAYKCILRSWTQDFPAIIGTHRTNYVSLNPEQVRQGFGQLERLLGTLAQEHPDAVYLTSYEVGQLYRRGTSVLQFGDQVVCRNYSERSHELVVALPEGKQFECLRNLRTDVEIPVQLCEKGVTFEVGDGDYVLELRRG